MIMPGLLKDRLLIVLLVLLGITLFSWLLMDATALTPKVTGALLLALAFVKVQVILSQYMELGKAALGVRIAFHAWLVLALGTVLALYLR